MDTVYSLIFELTLLGLLAWMYYTYQKRKLLRRATEQRVILKGKILVSLENNPQYLEFANMMKNHEGITIEYTNFQILPAKTQELIKDFNHL